MIEKLITLVIVAMLGIPIEQAQTEPQPQEYVVEKYTSIGDFKLTAYCSCKKCCGKWANNRPVDENGNEIVYGACSVPLEQGVSIAVDPNVIPLGSTVYIDGIPYVAHDTGGAIKGKRIDVYFSSHEDAVEFGVQYATVFRKEFCENDYRCN